MSATPTQQPWIIETGSRLLITAGKKGFVIAEVTRDTYISEVKQGEGEANARLIASAPQMYDLLTQIRNYTHEPLPEELQKEINHALFTINTQSR